MNQEWPKKISASSYMKRWYVDRDVRTVINHIKDGSLPGCKDGGEWCVWVNADLTPAFDYEAPSDYATQKKLSAPANDAVQRIIQKAS